VQALPAWGRAALHCASRPTTLFARFTCPCPAGSSLRAPLTRSLEFSSNVRVLAEAGDLQSADVVLEIPSEMREKVVAGLNAAGQVREFQLRLRMRFRLRTPRGAELIPMTELLLEREIGYAESAALAKEEEELLLYREMRQDMLQQILRRLAAVKDLSSPQPPSAR
jgi:LPS-assembly lipoprotein